MSLRDQYEEIDELEDQIERDHYKKVRLEHKIKLLREALQAIINECPEPQLPYGKRVVEIAKKALSK